MGKWKSPRKGSKPPKRKIIEDKKQRDEWAESVFMARAHENGLPVSKPWGDTSPYDFVVGTTGRFVSVQVKSTLNQPGTGYVGTVSALGRGTKVELPSGRRPEARPRTESYSLQLCSAIL